MTERVEDDTKRSVGSGGNDLLGLFAPPPRSPNRVPQLNSDSNSNSSLFTPPPPSESDPLLLSPSLLMDSSSSTGHDFRGKISLTKKRKPKTNTETIPELVGGGASIDTNNDGEDENDDLTTTVRTINLQKSNSDDNESPIRTKSINKNTQTTAAVFSESTDSGRECFLKKAAAASSAQKQQKQQQESIANEKAASKSCFVTGSGNLKRCLAFFLVPFASPSTWMGGILFVLYHVVFCMANGGSITRPYSGGSLLGDMARYTALGIIGSCPFLVFALGDQTNNNQIGIPAMYPSADLFLAPFLAEAAAIIDKIVFEDYKSGVIAAYHSSDINSISSSSSISNTNTSTNNLFNDPNDELFLTRLWFGSFALVVSFGMFAAGSLLILASKIKLANLGTYLPYGVLCGFFSSVGILMWKLAITIDTPTASLVDGNQPHWTVVLVHHLPSFLVGIAMSRQGPKHPFVVTGLIILTVVVFYGSMLVLGISLEEAQNTGWFYSHQDLQSSSSSVFSSDLTGDSNEGTMGVATNADDSWWNNRLLPPCPFGTWFALLGRYIHWRAVWKGSEHMIALAVLYLLRASIHAAALKKNIHNLIRRVPVEGATNEGGGSAAAEVITNTSIQKNDLEIGGLLSTRRSSPLRNKNKKHRRIDSLASVSSGMRMMAQTVKDEVRIVNLSLADRQSLRGKRYINSPHPTTQPHRMTSIGSNTTAVANNNPQRMTSIGSITTVGVRNTALVFPISPGTTPPVPPRSPLKHGAISERSQESDENSLLLPTTQPEISVLTQRTFASYANAESPSPGRRKASKVASNSIGNRASGEDSAAKYSVDYVEIHAPPTDLTLEDIFVQYGYGLFVTAACGGFGCCPTIATSNTMYAIGAGKSAPQYFSVALLLIAFYSSGFELVRFIPKAAFSSLLVLSAVDNIVTWFIKPLYKMDNLLEWSVVPFIAMFSLLVGFLNAVILGIGVSTFLFVTDFFRVGVVKYDASGLEIRSRIERSLVQSVWLDTHGDGLRVLVLQNYLFFGNASSVLRYIETMFEEIPIMESIRLEYPIPSIPAVLVLDLSLITGMDTSAVDVFMDIWRVCKSNDCKLYLCGLSPRLKKTFAKGGMRSDTKGARKSRTLLYFSDLDHGLGRAEDVLIDRDMGDFAGQSLFQLEKGGSGFHIALQHIDQLHSTKMAEGLLDLEPHTATVTLEEGQILYEKDGGLIRQSDHGLFFIESGMIREDDGRSNRTNTRTGGSLRNKSILAKENDNTLRGKHARLDTAARRVALTKLAGDEASHTSNNLRIATAGPGWYVELFFD